jgi:hypothetical protein
MRNWMNAWRKWLVGSKWILLVISNLTNGRYESFLNFQSCFQISSIFICSDSVHLLLELGRTWQRGEYIWPLSIAIEYSHFVIKRVWARMKKIIPLSSFTHQNASEHCCDEKPCLMFHSSQLIYNKKKACSGNLHFSEIGWCYMLFQQ